MRQILFILLAFFSASFLFAQKGKKEINIGNDLYKSGKYAEAEKAYKKNLGKNPNSFEGTFNLGNSYYKQGKYADAVDEYEHSTMMSIDSIQQANSYHNMGNSYYKAQQYDKSANAYKASLRLNPNDNQTRYNLALAQQKLKQQQQENPPPQPEEMQDKTAEQLLDAFNQDQQKLQEKMKQQVPPSQRQVEKDW